MLILFMAVGCLSAFSVYYVDISVPPGPGEQKITAGDVERMREIVRRTAEDHYLVRVDDSIGSYPREGISDLYVTNGNRSLDISLWLPPERREAGIAVTDWDRSVGAISPRARDIERRLRTELAAAFPGRQLKIEDKEWGFWAP